MALIATWIDRLMRIGSRPSDSPEELLRGATLTISTSLITVLAVGWVVTYAALGLWISAAFPLAYQVISISSLMALARTKRRDLFRTSQIGAVLLLPFLMQWSLGGFVASSGVMLWALLAPLGALLLQPERALRWFAAYLVLTVASGALEPVLAPRAAAIPAAVAVTFFVLNVAGVSAIAYIQLRYYMRARERALTALAEEHRLLELEREKSKLAALGTMAAGLMHELNNPAAAVVRSAAQLKETNAQAHRLGGRLRELSRPVLAEILDRPELGISDPLERAEREDEMGEWLEAQGVDEPWELAPALVAFGWKPDTLNELAADLTREQAALLVQWLATRHSSDLLTSELRTSANRISQLVQVAKRYAAVDQAPIQRVDVHAGLDDALVILGHKLGPDLNLRREYGSGLPEIEAYGAELNQVWTNLIDNAIAVMPDGGDLTIRTDVHNGRVIVDVIDTGPGIPPETQERMFEPFFTTKPPGQGMGLGLSTVEAVVARHQGEIRVTSRRGKTVFRIVLPTDLEHRHEGAG